MKEFKQTNHCLLYDNTIEGLLSAIYECCHKRIIPQQIISFDEYEEKLFDIVINIKTNQATVDFMNNKILGISDYSFYLMYTAFLSGGKNKEIIILKYFIEMITHKKKINGMKNNVAYINIHSICKKVSHEAHRFTGFTRFKLLPGNVLYSVIEPDNNIIEQLASHFKQRLKNEHFIIYDKTRGLIISYNTTSFNYFRDNEIDIKQLDQLSDLDEYEQLWKKYFDTIAIKERINKKCQMNFMPKKYWKNILEMEGKL